MLVTLTSSSTPYHGDLRFELEGLSLVAGTYYFELDRRVGAPDGMVAVRASLHALLVQWRACVEALENEASVALPFAYSDMHTGVLVVTRRGEVLDVATGFTTVEGWAHYPSDLPSFYEREPAIIPDNTSTVTTARSAFLSAIEESLGAIAEAIRAQTST